MNMRRVSFLLIAALAACSGSSSQPASPPVVVAAVPDATASSVAGPAAGVVADGTQTARLNVVLRDKSLAVIAGRTVSFFTASPGASVSPLSATTDASGAVHADVTSTKSGAVVVTAHADPVDLSADVTFVAGPPALSTSSITAGAALADGAATVAIRVTLHDAHDNPASGVAVSIAPVPGVQFDPPAGIADASGVFVSNASSRVVGVSDVSVTAGGVTLDRPVAFEAGPPDAAASAVQVPDSPIASDGLTPAAVVLTVRDAQGHLLSGVAVTAAASSGAVFSQPRGQTDAAGTFAGTLTSAVAGNATLTFHVGDADVVGSVTFSRSAPSLARSTVTASPSAAPAGTPIDIAVRIADVDDGPVAGAPVQLSADGIKTTLDKTAGTTGADGTFHATLTSPFAETKTVTAVSAPITTSGNVLLTGPSWQPLDGTNPGSLVRSLAFDPSNAKVVIAPGDKHVFRSTDGGQSWTPQPLDNGGAAFSVVFEPSGADAYVSGSPGFVSHDHGLTWQLTGVIGFNAVAVGPDGVVWFAVLGGGLQTTVDHGRTLIPIASQPMSNPRGVAVDPADAQRVYAWGLDGFFLSVDGGKSWSSPSSLPGATAVNRVVIDPVHPQNLYAATENAGLYRSTDRGASWTLSLPVPDNSLLPALTVDAQSHVFFLSASGVIESSADGVNWQSRLASGLSASALVADPGNPGTLWAAGIAGRSAGVYRSTDGGVTWTPSNAGMNEQVVFAVAADPHDRKVALASIFGQVVRTTDAGGTWADASSGLPDSQALSLFADPSRAGAWFVTVLNSGVYESVDGGSTWHPSLPTTEFSNPNRLTLTASSPVRLFNVDTGGQGFASVDDGATWHELPALPAGIDLVHACAADPKAMFAAGGAGIFHSADSGASWQKVRGPAAPRPPAIALSVDPVECTTAFVFFNDNALLRTFDAGATWNDIKPSAGDTVRSITFSPADHATLFVATARGLFRSTTQGNAWVLASDGFLDDPLIEGLGISPIDPDLIYAATQREGLWRTSTGGQ